MGAERASRLLRHKRTFDIAFVISFAGPLYIAICLPRFPDIRLTCPPTFLRSIWFNAVIDMPVVFTPETRA